MLLQHNRALELMLLTSQAAGVVASVVIARSVGPSGRGVLTALTTWGLTIGWLTALSLDKSIVVLARTEDPPVPPGVGLAIARRIVVALSPGALFLAFAVGWPIFHNWVYVLILATTALAVAQLELATGWALGRQRQGLYVILRLAQPSLYLASAVFLAVAFAGLGVHTRTRFIAIGTVVAVVLPVLLFTGRVHVRATKEDIARFRGPLVSFAVRAQVANALQYVNARLDVLTLSFLVSSSSLGVYAVGASLGQSVVLLGSAGVIRGITGKATRADLRGLALTSTFAAAVMLLAPFLIPRIFGEEFENATAVAQILCVGGVLNYALQGLAGRLLGQGRAIAVAVAQAAGLPAFAAGIAISRTLEGVAWASNASFAISLVVALVLVRRSKPTTV
jgi:O-antigen/teichoic acid export membrane protein